MSGRSVIPTCVSRLSYAQTMPGLVDYLDLRPTEARVQWRHVIERAPRPTSPGFRQVPFLPVETLLCLSAMLLVDHRRFGGRTSDLAPSPVPELARLTERTPASILAKMANLDGSRPNGARHEVETAAVLLADPQELAASYATVLRGARAEGVEADRLPDFLGLEAAPQLWLAGQDELVLDDLASAVEPRLQTLSGRMGGAPDMVTQRLLMAAVRIGQHRFATAVLRNFSHACGFCGLRPGSALERTGLLVASHIKPWRVSSDRERLDIANGIAACPTHDRAFDAGLLWVNGGYRIHSAEQLSRSTIADPGMAASFGRPPIADRLLLPAEGMPPGVTYLKWHRVHVVAA